jgi:hypothetical protein
VNDHRATFSSFAHRPDRLTGPVVRLNQGLVSLVAASQRATLVPTTGFSLPLVRGQSGSCARPASAAFPGWSHGGCRTRATLARSEA